MSHENLKSARRLYEAFNRGDLVSFEEGVSQDLEWNEADNSINCVGNPYRGFAAVVEGVFKPTTADIENFRVDLEQLIDGGDHVIGEGHYRGKGRTTGHELSAQFCHVLHFNGEGKLDRLQEYADTLHEAEVMGQVQRLEMMRMSQPAM